NPAWSVNGKTGMLESIDLKTLPGDLSDADTDNLTAEELDVKSLMATAYPDFSYGDMTSVYINSDLGIAAVALQAEGYADNGYVALIDTNSRELLIAIEVGCQPDMVCFTPDGTKILSANEGEPREGYESGTTDPLGSVSIITLDTDNLSASAVKTVDFTAYDSQREALVSAGVILAKGVSVSADLEPEYITATDTTVYVALQEANAIAVLDLDSGAFTGIYSLGYKDLSLEANAIDLIDDGDYVAKTYPDAIAAYMPDGISIYTVGGQTYILTANEGDSREWGSYSNESKTTLTASDGSTAEKVRTINADVTDGLPSGKTVLFGGRSFSIYQVSSGGLTQVYDSANDFEENTAKYVASYFNCSNDDNDYDSRSQKKGPEPETVTVGTVGSRTYAFIALERVGGIMMYDITDPSNAYFVNYINSRDYSEDPSSGASLSSDISPEGLYFISAEASASGTPILLAAFEVSGTVAAYAVGDTPAGHTYGKPVFRWATDHSSCTAVFTCSKCGDEETVTCTIAKETTAATAAENGSIVYTAACVFNNTEYSDEYSEIIPVTGTSGGSSGNAAEASGGSADNTAEASGGSNDSAAEVSGESDNNFTATQIVMQSLTDDVISDDLKAAGFDTVEKITSELQSQLVTLAEGYSAADSAVYDVQLRILTDGKWRDATEEDFPTEGIEVVIPYPDGTGKNIHDYFLIHMFAVTSARLNTVAGNTETPAVTEADDGIHVVLTGLSPILIGWTETSDNTAVPAYTATQTGTTDSGSTSATTAAAVAATGDTASIYRWILLALCGAGCAAGIGICKRKHTGR
ncbi:MAG: choice-of-anchor I family protein, partial [Clostridiales bacterium]|nr:choice-of-anchor I family protein [Clostridiales bacterium]